MLVRLLAKSLILVALTAAVEARAQDENETTAAEAEEGADAPAKLAKEPANGPKKIDISWGAVEGAVGYDVEVALYRNGERQGEKILASSAKNRWVHALPPGRYRMRVRSLDSREVPGVWSKEIPFAVPFAPIAPRAPAPAKVIKSKKADTAPVAFAWKAPAPGLSYKLEVFAAGDDDGGAKPVAAKVVKAAKASLALPVAAAYTWRVTPLDEGEPLGEASEALPSFEIHGPAVGAPKLTKKYDPDDKRLEWTTPDKAETFAVKLAALDPRTNKWKTLHEKKGVKEAELAIKNDWPLGKYALEVIAEADRRGASRALKYNFERELTEDSRIVRPALFLRLGLAPTLLVSKTTGIEPEPSVTALIFTAYDLLIRVGKSKIALEAGHSQRSTTLFEGQEETAGGDVPQPPLEYNTSRTHAALNYFLSIGGRLALEPFLGVARRAFVLLNPTDQRTLTTTHLTSMALLVGSDLTVRFNDAMGLRGRGSYEKVLTKSDGVTDARFLVAEGTLVRTFGKSGFTLAGGYQLSLNNVDVYDEGSQTAGKMTEQQHALLLALAFAY